MENTTHLTSKELRKKIELLKLYKVYPKIQDFHHLKYKYYMYVYLDPFKELDKPLLFKSKKHEYISAYEPIYIGKASSGTGYRHNQHITNYINKKEHNPQKIKKFQELEKNFRLAEKQHSFTKPHNWKEYQSGWIILLEAFNDPKKLLESEVELIKNIGTVYNKKGPLVNKIENSNIL